MESPETDVDKSVDPLLLSKTVDLFCEIKLIPEAPGSDQQVENKTQQKVRRKPSLFVWKTLVSSLAVVTTLQLVGLLALTVAWKNKRNQALLPREHTLCVPCDLIKDTSDKIPEGFGINHDASTNLTNCCNAVSKILNIFIKEQAEEQFYDGYASRMFSESGDCPNVQVSKPSAMLAGIALEKMGTKNAVHWKEITLPKEHTGQIQHNNGKLSIKQSGYYYVFSQLKWEFRNNAMENTMNDTEPVFAVNGDAYSHTVHLDSQPSPILEGSKASCDFKFRKTEATSPLGAVFFLDKDETITVKTSHPQHLVPCNHSNFFGLYKL